MNYTFRNGGILRQVVLSGNHKIRRLARFLAARRDRIGLIARAIFQPADGLSPQALVIGGRAYDKSSLAYDISASA
jgi:hypothetical protein